jgi:hypothetical protein
MDKLGKVEEGIEGSHLNFLVSKNVMGKVPIVAATISTLPITFLDTKKI